MMAWERPLRTEPWHVQRPPSPLDGRSSEPESRSIRPEQGLAGDIDLREEIQAIMATRGHWVFLRRTQDRRCGCWNDTLRESKQDCPHCTGTGWLYRDERHLSRKMPLTDPMVAATLEAREPVGLIGAAQFVFWFGPDVYPGPSKRDQILEVTTGRDDGEIVEVPTIELVWNIGQVQGYRDKFGRLEFWACWVKEGAIGKE